MENNDLNIKIKQFLDGKMDAATTAAFKKEMAENKTLAEEVGLARIERLMKARMLDNYMEGKLAEWQVEDAPPPAPGGKAGPKNGYWLLLLLPLLAAGAWWYLYPTEKAVWKPVTPAAEEQPTAPEKQQETVPQVPGQAPQAAPSNTPGTPAQPVPNRPVNPTVPIAQAAPTDAALMAMLC